MIPQKGYYEGEDAVQVYSKYFEPKGYESLTSQHIIHNLISRSKKFHWVGKFIQRIHSDHQIDDSEYTKCTLEDIICTGPLTIGSREDNIVDDVINKAFLEFQKKKSEVLLERMEAYGFDAPFIERHKDDFTCVIERGVDGFDKIERYYYRLGKENAILIVEMFFKPIKMSNKAPFTRELSFQYR